MSPWRVPSWVIHLLAAVVAVLVMAGLTLPWWGPA